MPKVFKYIQEKGNIDNEEMLKVLNCGIGMILIANKNDSTNIIKDLDKIKIKAKVIGSIIEKKENLKLST